MTQASSSTLPRGARGYAVLLRRNPNLRNVWLGQVVSQAGDWFNTVAVLGLLIQLTSNPGSASLVIVAQILPSAIMGLFVSGAIADRFDRKKVMIAADLARAVIALSFLFVKSPDLTWMAYAATAGLSIGGSFFNAASSAGMPNLVTREELPLANALHQSTFASMLLIGSAIGGVVTQFFGRDVAFVMNSLSFAASAFFIWRTTANFNAAGSVQVVAGAGALRILTEGFRYLKQNPQARMYALAKPFYSWVFGAIGLYGAYALTIYKIGDMGTSLLYIGRGLGALISPLVAMSLLSLTDTQALGRAIRIGMFITLIGYAIFAVSTSPIIGIVGTFFGHFGAALAWTFSRMILQISTPDYVRGRVMALDDVMMSVVTSASNVGVGLIASTVSLEAGAWAAVSAGLVGTLAWMWAARKIPVEKA
jgi:MFS family permease